MIVKKFSQFIKESFDREEERRLRDLGLGPTKWFVGLILDLHYAAQTSPEIFMEDFKDWIDRDFSTGAWRIDSESIELEEWDPEAYEFGELEEAPSVAFTLITETAENGLVEEWLENNLIGRVFEEINDLQKIEADEAY